MSRNVTIYTIAEMAGISISTVSRIINNTFSGDERTRKTVLATMKQLNYRPSREARRLTGKRVSAGVIGIMAPFFIHPFFVEVLKGAYRAIHNSDHSILLYDVDTKVMKKKVIRRIVDENLIDGLLIVNMHLNRDEYNLISEKIPLVLVAAETDFADSVIVDNYKGIVTGVQYLFELGHRKVAFINNEKEILESRVREKAFRDEADRLGIRYKIDYREVDRRSGYLAAKTVFNNWPEVTCLFYYSDLMAFGGIDFVNENNLHERVSIIGFDGFEMSSHIGLTTIVQPMEKMGEIGALVLKNKIESKSSELKRIVLETWLEKGKTCRKIAG